MPYPFAPMPTLGEFITCITSDKYKVKIRRIKSILSGPRGQAEVKYLIKTGNNGKSRIAVIPNLKDHELLIPSVLRSLCIQLDIPVEDFGLILG